MAISLPYRNVSDRKSTFHKFNLADDNREYDPEKITDCLIWETHFDWEPHAHHHTLQYKPKKLLFSVKLLGFCIEWDFHSAEQFFHDLHTQTEAP